jgi:hypothetical protein
MVDGCFPGRKPFPALPGGLSQTCIGSAWFGVDRQPDAMQGLCWFFPYHIETKAPVMHDQRTPQPML